MANEFKVKKGLIVDGSGTVLDVQGTEGQLFSITDSLTGDLFSVSDVSGIPIFNVNSSGDVDVDGELNIKNAATRFISLNYEDSVNSIISHSGTNYGLETLHVRGDQIKFYTDYDASSPKGDLTLTLDTSHNATFTGNIISETTGGNAGIKVITANDAEGFLIFGDAQDNSMGGMAYNNATNTLDIDCNNGVALSFDSSRDATFSGDVMPAAENAYNIGSASVRWEDLYVDDGYIRNAYIDEYVYHNGDTDTNARFQDNRLTLTSGGGAVVDLHSNGNLYFTGDAVFYNTIKLAGSSNEIIKSDGSVRIDIDNNNNQTDRIFIVSNHNAANELFKVDESGNGTFAGSVTPKKGLDWLTTDGMNSGGGTAWKRIGTWAAGQSGRMLRLQIIAGSGYNATTGQQGYLTVILRTSNGSSTQTATNGAAVKFSGHFYQEGKLRLTDNSIRVEVSATDEYTIYMNTKNFIGASPIIADASEGTTFTVHADTGGSSSNFSSSNYLDLVETYESQSDSIFEGEIQAHNHIKLNATNKLFLDGGGNTYIQEVAGDDIDIVAGGNNSIQIRGANTTFAGTITVGGDITATGADFTLAHAAGATMFIRRDDTSISDGDVIGLLNFQGDDPSDGTFNTGVAIKAVADGTWQSGKYPGELLFQTRADSASSSLTTALTLGSDQKATFTGTVQAPYITANNPSGAANGSAQEIARFVNTSSGATSSYMYIGASSGTDWRLGKNINGTSSNTNFGITKHSGTALALEIDTLLRTRLQSTDDYVLGLRASGGTDQWWLKAYNSNGNFAIHENGVGDQFTIAAGGTATFEGDVSINSDNLTLTTPASVPLLSLETSHTSGIPIINLKGAASGQVRYQDENGTIQSRIDLLDGGAFSFIDAQSSTTYLGIDSSGNATLTRALNIVGTAATFGMSSNATQVVDIIGDAGDSNARLRIQFDSINDDLVGAAGKRTFIGDGASDIVIGTANSSYSPTNSFISLEHDGKIRMAAGASPTLASEGLTIDTDGSVGIGTGAPSAKFEVQGTSGQLFSITDSLTGDLFSVSDVSGVPILNVNSSGAVEVDGTFKIEETSTFKGDVEIHNEGNDTTGKLTIAGNNNTGTPGVKTSGTIEHRGADLKTIITHNGSDVITVGTGTQTTFAGNVFTPGLYVNATTPVAGTQVAIVQNGNQNLQRWGSSSDGGSAHSYRFRIDQNFNFIANSGGGDVITMQSSNGNITTSGDIAASQLTVDDYIYHAGDSNTYIYFTPDNIKLRTGGDDRLELSNTAATFTNKAVIGSGGTNAWGNAEIDTSTSAGWNSSNSYPYVGSNGGSSGSLIMLHNPHIPFRTDNARSGASGRSGLRCAIDASATGYWDIGLTGDAFEIYRNASATQLMTLNSSGNAAFSGDVTAGDRFISNAKGHVLGTNSATAQTAVLELKQVSGAEQLRLTDGDSLGTSWGPFISFYDGGGTRRGYVQGAGTSSTAMDMRVVSQYGSFSVYTDASGGVTERFLIGSNGGATFRGDLTGESYVRSLGSYQITLDGVSGAGPIIEFGATNDYDAYGSIGHQGGEYQFGTHSRDFAWYQGSTKIMELDYGGGNQEPVLAIGWNVAADNTKGTLQVFGHNNTDGTLRLGPHSSKGSIFSHVHYGSNGDWYIRPASNSGSVFVLNYSAISDERLKENIVDSEYGLSEITSLRPRNFNWIGSETNDVHTGFVAQEVEAVVPKWITQGELDDHKSVDYNAITATLVKAIQELKAENEDLLNRVKALESK